MRPTPAKAMRQGICTQWRLQASPYCQRRVCRRPLTCSPAGPCTCPWRSPCRRLVQAGCCTLSKLTGILHFFKQKLLHHLRFHITATDGHVGTDNGVWEIECPCGAAHGGSDPAIYDSVKHVFFVGHSIEDPMGTTERFLIVCICIGEHYTSI